MLEEAGQPIDDDLIAPQVSPHLLLYISAFYKLLTCRTLGMAGYSAIPLSDVIMYADRYCCSQEQSERFINFILMMDSAHMRAINDGGDNT